MRRRPPAPPRVTLVAHQVHDGGGMERAFAELVRHAGDRIDFEVVSTTLADDLKCAVRWRRVPVPRRPVPVFFSSFYGAAGCVVARHRTDLVHAMGALIPNRADLVSVQFCHRAYAALPAEQTAVVGGRARRINRLVDRRLALLAEEHAYRPGRSGTLAAASTGVQRELAKYYPRVPTRVIPNAVDSVRFGPDGEARRDLRATWGFADSDVVAIFVGGDWNRKGLGIAIRALGAARAAGAANLRLLVVGRGDESVLDETIECSGAAGCVTFAGWTDRPESAFAAADLMVFPTSYEAFPLAALEGASCGLPLVAARVNGVEDLITDGREGFVLDRRDDAFAGAMSKLAMDPDLRASMAAAARTSAQRFNWRAVADATIRTYDELLGRSG